jgi:hypothetical protein
MRDVMRDIFKIIKADDQKEEGKKALSIGIDFQIAGREICYPVSKNCHSYEELLVEIEAIQGNLERMIEEAKTNFKGPTPKDGSEFTTETSPEELWTILSGIQDELDFVKRFNSLDDTRRKEVADHVITKCNVFSGRGSIFSARYNNGTGYME